MPDSSTPHILPGGDGCLHQTINLGVRAQLIIIIIIIMIIVTKHTYIILEIKPISIIVMVARIDDNGDDKNT